MPYMTICRSHTCRFEICVGKRNESKWPLHFAKIMEALPANNAITSCFHVIFCVVSFSKLHINFVILKNITVYPKFTNNALNSISKLDRRVMICCWFQIEFEIEVNAETPSDIQILLLLIVSPPTFRLIVCVNKLFLHKVNATWW